MEKNLFCRAIGLLGFGLFGFVLATPLEGAERLIIVPKWERFEATFRSKKNYENPLQNCSLGAVFTSPSGASHTAFGFWDGGRDWKIRFSPNEVGRWLFTTVCSDKSNSALENQNGTFVCTAATGKNRFSQHGP